MARSLLSVSDLNIKELEKIFKKINRMWKKLLNTLRAEVVEPGRHARLRGVWGNPCGFESRLRHHLLLL